MAQIDLETEEGRLKAAQNSKYYTLWNSFQKRSQDPKDQMYIENYGMMRSNYGAFKAYEARRAYETELLKNGATYEDVALMRSYNENYSQIAQDISLIYNPNFVNNAIQQYLYDEIAFEEIALNTVLYESTDVAFIEHLKNISNLAQTEEGQEKMWQDSQTNELQKRKLDLIGLDTEEKFKEAMGYFALQKKYENQRDGGNLNDILVTLGSSTFKGFADMFASLYDFVPVIADMFGGADSGFMKDWLDSGKAFRGGISGVSDWMLGDTKYKQFDGAWATAVDVSGAVGSVVGLMAAFATGAAIVGGIGKGANALLGATKLGKGVTAVKAASTLKFATLSPKIQKALAISGKIVNTSSGWVAIQQGANVYYTGKDAGYSNSEIRKAYASTIVGNMALLAITGAVPGSEISGAAPLMSIKRLKQFGMAFLKEGLEENIQQNIENYALSYGSGDIGFAQFMKEATTNMDLKTFMISGLIGMGMGGVSHVKTNKAINAQFGNISYNNPYIMQQLADIKENYQDFGFVKQPSDLQVKDYILNQLMNGNDNIVVNQIANDFMKEVAKSEVENFVKTAKTTYDITNQVNQFIMADAIDALNGVNIKFDSQKAMELILRNGVPTTDVELSKQAGYMSLNDFKNLYLMENNIASEDIYWKLPEDQRIVFDPLAKGEVAQMIEEIRNRTITEQEFTKIKSINDFNAKINNPITVFNNADLTISELNNLYGSRNLINQQIFKNIKTMYETTISKLKNSLMINDVNTIKELIKDLTPQQVDALMNVSDGVKLTPMEVKKLSEFGVKSSNETTNKMVEISKELDNLKLDEINGNLTIEKINDSLNKIKEKVDITTLDRSELSKYLFNKDVMNFLDKNPMEIINSQEVINNAKQELENIKNEQLKESQKLEKVKEETIKETKKTKKEKAINEISKNPYAENVEASIDKYSDNAIQEITKIEKEQLKNTKAPQAVNNDVKIVENAIKEKIELKSEIDNIDINNSKKKVESLIYNESKELNEKIKTIKDFSQTELLEIKQKYGEIAYNQAINNKINTLNSYVDGIKRNVNKYLDPIFVVDSSLENKINSIIDKNVDSQKFKINEKNLNNEIQNLINDNWEIFNNNLQEANKSIKQEVDSIIEKTDWTKEDANRLKEVNEKLNKLKGESLYTKQKNNYDKLMYEYYLLNDKLDMALARANEGKQNVKIENIFQANEFINMVANQEIIVSPKMIEDSVDQIVNIKKENFEKLTKELDKKSKAYNAMVLNEMDSIINTQQNAIKNYEDNGTFGETLQSFEIEDANEDIGDGNEKFAIRLSLDSELGMKDITVLYKFDPRKNETSLQFYDNPDATFGLDRMMNYSRQGKINTELQKNIIDTIYEVYSNIDDYIEINGKEIRLDYAMFDSKYKNNEQVKNARKIVDQLSNQLIKFKQENDISKKDNYKAKKWQAIVSEIEAGKLLNENIIDDFGKDYIESKMVEDYLYKEENNLLCK